MTAIWFSMFLALAAANQPPGLGPVPDALMPYVAVLRHEPEFRGWLLSHRTTQDPLGDFIEDNTQPVRLRQRAWQFRRKIREG